MEPVSPLRVPVQVGFGAILREKIIPTSATLRGCIVPAKKRDTLVVPRFINLAKW